MTDLLAGLENLPLLQRLGATLFAASCVGMGGAGISALVLRRRSAALRALVWFAGFVAIVVFAGAQLSGFALRLPVWKESARPAAVRAVEAGEPARMIPSAAPPVFSASPARPSLSGGAAPVPARTRIPDAGSWLAGLWIAGAAVGLARIVAGIAGLRACIRSATPFDRQDVAGVCLHPDVDSPISFGCLRTWIVLPVEAAGWSAERLRLVIRHESAHGERRDFLLTLIARAIAALCWPNPLVWLGLREFRRLCEDAADDRAASGMDAAEYAGELLALLRDLRRPPRRFRHALSVTGGSPTRARVRRLLDEWIDRALPTRRQTVAILAAAAGIALACGAVRFVQARPGGDEAGWEKKLAALRVPTPNPGDPPNPGDFTSTRAFWKAHEAFWGAFWAVEYPRLWKLAKADEEFLSRFPDSAQAPAACREMADSFIRCLNDKGAIGKDALAWIEATLARPDLAPAEALPFYIYQANMIGIHSNGGNIDSLAPVPNNDSDIPEAIGQLVEAFEQRFPGTPELGELFNSASYYVEREDRNLALRYLDRAKALMRDDKKRAKIDGARFRLTAEGRPVPPLAFTALDGRKIDLTEWKGRVVLLDFWATWCPPCVDKVPEMQAIYERWKDSGLVMIGISLDKDRSQLDAFLAAHEMPWPQDFDGKGWDGELLDRFGVRSIPSLWVIDREGNVAAVNPRDPLPVLERLLGPGHALAPGTMPTIGERQQTKGPITVRVVDADGKPIPGAKIHRSIWTRQEGYKANADYLTGANGEAAFDPPRQMSILRLWATKEGRVGRFANWEIDEKNATTFPETVTFVLNKGTRLGGCVVDENGGPIAGAKVEVQLDDSNSDTTGAIGLDTWLAEGSAARVTDAQGAWSLDNAPPDADAEFLVKVSHPDFIDDRKWGGYQREQNVTSDQLRAGTARVAMARGLSLEGRVTGPDGGPVPGALVIWGDDPYDEEGSQEVRADASGHFRLPPHAPETVTLTVVAPGFSPFQQQAVIAPSTEPVNVRLEPGTPLRIEFVDGSGKPLPGVHVTVQTWRHKRALYNVRHPNVMNTDIPDVADDSGVYAWDWAPPDPVKYAFWKDGYRTVENQMFGPGPHRVELLEGEE